MSPSRPPEPPRPTPPEPPDAADCCGEGCMNCIYDIHEAAMQRYQEALADWESRRRHADGVPEGPSTGDGESKD